VQLSVCCKVEKSRLSAGSRKSLKAVGYTGKPFMKWFSSDPRHILIQYLKLGYGWFFLNANSIHGIVKSFDYTFLTATLNKESSSAFE
jgi:hypothetical protein